MKNLPFGPVFKTKDELLISFSALRFPKHGSFYANQMHGYPELKLELMSVDIPRVGKTRYLVVEAQADGSFFVVCDFIDQTLPIVRVIERGDSLDFLSRSNEVMLAKNLVA